MVSLALVILAAVCNAVMDKLQFHFYESIFVNREKLDPKFWNPEISWKNKYSSDLPDPLTDAWHIFKSLTIILLVSAIVVYSPIINLWVDFILFGLAWNLTFNLFFNRILAKEEK